MNESPQAKNDPVGNPTPSGRKSVTVLMLHLTKFVFKHGCQGKSVADDGLTIGSR